MTTIGLCFGGGQIMLGCLGTALGFAMLIGMKWIDHGVPRRHEVFLTIVVPPELRAPT